MTAQVTNFSTAGSQGQEKAEILNLGDKGYLVKSASGLFSAQKAYSCLLKPQKGDQVLVSFVEQQVWITAILVRIDSAVACIEVEGDLEIKSAEGRVSLSAQHITQEATGSLTINSSNMQVNAIKERHVCKDLSLTSEATQLSSVKADMKAQNITLSVGFILQSIKNSVRVVKETDKVSAANLIQTVRQCFKNHSKNTIMTSDSDIKIDAKRIHMG